MHTFSIKTDAPVFAGHPVGWRTADEIVGQFALAWALEIRERSRLSPGDPMGAFADTHLAPRYRFDTLGQMMRLLPGTPPAVYRDRAVTRLPVLSAAWRVFEIIREQLHLSPGDSSRVARAMSLVLTDENTDSGLFGRSSAGLAKCLVGTRILRAGNGSDLLVPAEEWFATGDPSLISNESGVLSLSFNFGMGGRVELPISSPELVASLWSSVQLLVARQGAQEVIDAYQQDVPYLEDILARGAATAAHAKATMTPMSYRWFNYWPGW